MFAAYIPSKKWDVSFTVNGFLAGLVAITCPCYWVSPTGRHPARRRRRRHRGARRRTARMAAHRRSRSARCRCTASAASGERSRWACSPAASTARPGRSRRTTPLRSRACSTAAACTVLTAQAIGSAIITAATFGVALIVMYAGQRDRAAARLAGGRAGRPRPARARHLGLPGVRHLVARPAPGSEPRPAVAPPDGQKRFAVVVEGVGPTEGGDRLGRRCVSPTARSRPPTWSRFTPT